MQLADASVQPRRADTIEEARTLLGEDGVALVRGFRTVHEVTAYGVAFLGQDGVLVKPQFSTTTDDRNYRTTVPRGVPDQRGRVVSSSSMDEDLPVHNDGKTFGDFSPDYIFLWAEVVCPVAGESVLIDGVKLLELLGGESAYRELVEFCWNVPIDVSEAHHQLPEPSLIARATPGGRYQIRCHRNLRAVQGLDERRHQALIDQWVTLVQKAETEARTFRLEAGEVLAIDNFRLLHGRRAYVTPERRMTSVWAWSSKAAGVPSEQPCFERPEALLVSG